MQRKYVPYSVLLKFHIFLTPTGIGTFESRTGIYIGSWKSGLQEGNGTAIYNNGNRYDGEFEAGFKHGYGKFTVTTNNDIYTGTFDRGVRQGEVGYFSKFDMN